jgi:hypothetical protein
MGNTGAFERVAAVDVAKRDRVVCLRRRHPSSPGRQQSLVWMVAATLNSARELAARLAAERVRKVTLDSTAALPTQRCRTGADSETRTAIFA